MADEWLEQFVPDAEDLLALLQAQVDDAMLMYIATADYGQDSEENLLLLRQFRDSRIVPALDWCPREVLELERWSEPDRQGGRPGSEGRRGHLSRAFVCAMLLRSYVLPENAERWESFNETVLQLLASALALGEETLQPTARFFAWCMRHLAPLDPFDGPFLGLALLRLVTSLPDPQRYPLVALCEWVDRNVSALLEDYQGFATDEYNWLLSTNHHNQRNENWIEIGRSLYQWAASQPESTEATWVALIGRSLAED